jgi:hypothetical protein
LRRSFEREDRKIGTDSLAIVTVDTQIGLLYRRRVVSFRVEPLGELENISWAIFDTVAAPFASVFYDIDHPFGNHDLFGIQGNAPEFHLLTSSNVINW